MAVENKHHLRRLEMTMQRIGQLLALVIVATVITYGSQPQASAQGGMHDGMQQGSSMPAGQTQSTQGYKITLRTEPEALKGGQENTFHVSVTDPDGKPVSDASVKLTLDMAAMPEMNMAAMKVSPTVAWDGSDYSGKASVPSAGQWSVTVRVVRQNQVIASKKTKLMAK
jgi:hypothetical protein